MRPPHRRGIDQPPPDRRRLSDEPDEPEHGVIGQADDHRESGEA
jgi:hypothetical protein